MNSKTFFISGSPGCGKTPIIARLKFLLGQGFDVRDFDE
jgi:nucleoside-triphosphatase THEP1